MRRYSVEDALEMPLEVEGTVLPVPFPGKRPTRVYWKLEAGLHIQGTAVVDKKVYAAYLGKHDPCAVARVARTLRKVRRSTPSIQLTCGEIDREHRVWETRWSFPGDSLLSYPIRQQRSSNLWAWYYFDTMFGLKVASWERALGVPVAAWVYPEAKKCRVYTSGVRMSPGRRQDWKEYWRGRLVQLGVASLA